MIWTALRHRSSKSCMPTLTATPRSTDRLLNAIGRTCRSAGGKDGTSGIRAESRPNTNLKPETLNFKQKPKNEGGMAGRPPRASCFTPPSVDEVRAYCSERKNSVDPERFVDFYAANGRKQGRGKPIVDWKAAVRTWERNEDTKQAPAPAEDWTVTHPEWLDQSTWVPGPDGIYRPAGDDL